MNISRFTQLLASTIDRRGSATTQYHCPTDTLDAEGVLFIAVGSSHWTPKTTDVSFHLQGSSYSSAGWTKIGSTRLISSTKFATGLTEKCVMVDCYKPTRRWVRLASHHTTGDYTVVSMKYGMRRSGSTDVLGGTGQVTMGADCYALSISAT